MAPIKTNNPAASYFDFFSQSGKDAVSPVPPPVPPFTATGGTKIDDPDGYSYHFFTSNDNFVTNTPGPIDYVIVGGGGAGTGQPHGNNYGGGGAGAGGVRTGSLTIGTGTNPVVIGATKSGAAVYPGAVGNPSVAFGVTAQGGGSGGGYNQTNVVEFNGGSGGGAPHYSSSAIGLGSRVTGTTDPAPDTGNNGGAGGNTASGGGGGAGGVGGNSAPPGVGGKGGLGIAFPGWAIPPSYGTPEPSGPIRYFAGGGGGGGNSTGGAAPDAGGGGVGAASANGGDATANTGGGGGSAAGNGTLTGGDGGSGIVICRYNT